MRGRNNSGGFRQAFTPPPAMTPPSLPTGGGETMNRIMPVNPVNATPPVRSMPVERVMPPSLNPTETPMMSSPGGANVATPAQRTNFTGAPQPPPTEQPAYGIPTQVPEMDPGRRRMMLPQ